MTDDGVLCFVWLSALCLTASLSLCLFASCPSFAPGKIAVTQGLGQQQADVAQAPLVDGGRRSILQAAVAGQRRRGIGLKRPLQRRQVGREGQRFAMKLKRERYRKPKLQKIKRMTKLWFRVWNMAVQSM